MLWKSCKWTLQNVPDEQKPGLICPGYILLSVQNHTLFCHKHFPAKIWTANCITQPQTYYIYSDDQHYHMSRLMTKPIKCHMRPAKAQFSLGIRPVWSESSLSARRTTGSLVTHKVDSEASDQAGRMPRLIWVFVGRTCHLLVLSWGSSYI